MTKLLATIVPSLLMCATTALSTPPTTVGPDVVEPPDEDAGSFPGTARETDGTGPVFSISGNLGGLGLGPAGPDFHDAWIICISDPENWSATLIPGDGGFAINFDPRLYLFRLDDFGLLGNDDTDIIPGPMPERGLLPESTLLNASNDGGPQVVIEEGGLYVIIVTTNDNDPQSGSGQIFVFDDPGEISSPDGPGGGGGIEAWEEAIGACCMLDLQCDNLKPSECLSAGGFFLSEQDCKKISCPSVGACCIDLSCIITDGSTCEELSGFFNPGDDCFVCSKNPGPTPPRPDDRRFEGNNGLGSPGPAGPGDYRIIFTGTCFSSDVPTGACCLPGGVCIELTELVCGDAGGDYQGEGAECINIVCPGGDAVGACCFDYGQCAVLPAVVCVALEGLPQGPGTDCGTFECPDNTGACCFTNGQCAILPRDTCLEMGGLPQGIGSACADVNCVDLTGACCFADGSCAFLPRDECLDLGGLPQGGNTVCGPGACPQPDEACCFDDGQCAMLMPGVCLGLGGLPQGGGTDCGILDCPDPPPPPPPPLACCADDDNELSSVTFEYTGDPCAASNHGQGDDASCTDFGPLANDVYIVAADDDDLDDADIWFEGWVSMDQTFTASAASDGEDELDEDTVILIFAAPDGPLLQEVELVTDCDEPLNTGDRFGALRVVGCVFD